MASLGHEYAFRRFSKAATFTITICMSREFRVRMAVATALFRLGIWVLGCSGEVKTEEAEHE